MTLSLSFSTSIYVKRHLFSHHYMVPTSFAKHHPQVAQSFHLWSPTEESDQKKGQDLARTCFFASYTWHSTLYTFQFTLHTGTRCTPHSKLYTFHSTIYTVHFTSTLYTLHSTLHTPQSPLHILHTTFPTQHSTVYTGTATGEECTRLLK